MQLESFFGFLGASHLISNEIEAASTAEGATHASGFGSMLASAFGLVLSPSDDAAGNAPDEDRSIVGKGREFASSPQPGVLGGFTSSSSSSSTANDDAHATTSIATENHVSTDAENHVSTDSDIASSGAVLIASFPAQGNDLPPAQTDNAVDKRLAGIVGKRSAGIAEKHSVGIVDKRSAGIADKHSVGIIDKHSAGIEAGTSSAHTAPSDLAPMEDGLARVDRAEIVHPLEQEASDSVGEVKEAVITASSNENTDEASAATIDTADGPDRQGVAAGESPQNSARASYAAVQEDRESSPDPEPAPTRFDSVPAESSYSEKSGRNFHAHAVRGSDVVTQVPGDGSASLQTATDTTVQKPGNGAPDMTGEHTAPSSPDAASGTVDGRHMNGDTAHARDGENVQSSRLHSLVARHARGGTAGEHTENSGELSHHGVQRRTDGSFELKISDSLPTGDHTRAAHLERASHRGPLLGASTPEIDRSTNADRDGALLNTRGDRLRMWNERAAILSASRDGVQRTPSGIHAAGVDDAPGEHLLLAADQRSAGMEADQLSNVHRTGETTAEHAADPENPGIVGVTEPDEPSEPEVRHEARDRSSSETKGSARSNQESNPDTGTGANGKEDAPGDLQPAESAPGDLNQDAAADGDPLDVQTVSEDGASFVSDEAAAAGSETAAGESTSSAEKASGPSSTSALEMLKSTGRKLQPGTSAWLRSVVHDGLDALGPEDLWKVLEIQLEEGHGTMTVRARRSDDKVTIAVSFSDPHLRSLAAENADRIHDLLQAQYDSDVEFSLSRQGSENSSGRHSDSHAGGRTGSHDALRTGDSMPMDAWVRAARAAAFGARNEWVG